MFILPNKDKSNKKGLTITALVFNSILAILYISAGSWCLIFPSTCVGLFITALCVGNKKKPEENAEYENNNKNLIVTETIQEDKKETTKTNIEAEDKIKMIKKLYKEGSISEEDMKRLILKELDK